MTKVAFDILSHNLCYHGFCYISHCYIWCHSVSTLLSLYPTLPSKLITAACDILSYNHSSWFLHFTEMLLCHSVPTLMCLYPIPPSNMTTFPMIFCYINSCILISALFPNIASGITQFVLSCIYVPLHLPRWLELPFLSHNHYYPGFCCISPQSWCHSISILMCLYRTLLPKITKVAHGILSCNYSYPTFCCFPMVHLVITQFWLSCVCVWGLSQIQPAFGILSHYLYYLIFSYIS
jgi:hypothetical protein